MSSFLINLLIPVLVALAVFRVRAWDAWIWSWGTLVADVDYVFWMTHVGLGWPNLHRALFHNAWIAMALGLAGYLAFRRWRDRTGGTHPGFLTAKPGWVLVPFYNAAAVFLDVLAGGVTLFWPVSNITVFWSPSIIVNTDTAVPTPVVESPAGSFQGTPDVSPQYTWMTGEEIGILLIYVAALLLMYAARRWGHGRRLRPARPVQIEHA